MQWRAGYIVALLAAGMAVAAVLVWPRAKRPVPPNAALPQPNVVLIVVDTLRADHVGAYGYDLPTTPNIDALASRGVRWSQYYSNSSWTRPGMATMITGLYPRQTGIYEERFDALPDDLVTLAERLQAAGWFTLGVTANPNINAVFGFDQGFDAYLDSEVVFKFMPEGGGYRRFRGFGNPLVGADEVTDRALALLDHHAVDIAAAPFFLQVLYLDPHIPTEPPAEHLQAVGGGEGRVPLYDGEVRFADAELGRLLDALDQAGHLADALVIVTSDHGEGLRDHPELPLAGSHGHTLYDSVLRVPLVLSHPDLPEGAVVDALSDSVDLVPTVLALLGLATDPALPGQSLAAHARGDDDPPPLPDHVFGETDWRYAHKASVRSATWRYVRNDDCAVFQATGVAETEPLEDRERGMLLQVPARELYRVGVSPENPGSAVARDPDRHEGLALAALLDAWLSSVDARPPIGRAPDDFDVVDGIRVQPAPDGAVPEIGDDVSSQLRALGYLE